MRSEISISELNEALIFYSEKYNNMLLMGEPKNHHLKDFIDSNDFENLINKPTHFKSTLPTTIDLFFDKQNSLLYEIFNKRNRNIRPALIIRNLWRKNCVRKLWRDPVCAISIVKIAHRTTGQTIKSSVTFARTFWRKQKLVTLTI